MKSIRILIFDGVELLDFAGPLEVFSAADYLLGDSSPFDIKTIAIKNSIVVSKSEIKISPNITNEDQPLDLLIIPGGIGTRRIIEDAKELKFVQDLISQSKTIASVCTGALILGKMGKLDGQNVTTHAVGVPLLEKISPLCTIDRTKRYIDNGSVITSAGISAGIDMSLYLLEKYYGVSFRNEVQLYLEYQS